MGPDLSITNFAFFASLALPIIQLIVFLIKDGTSKTFFAIPGAWQHIIEKSYMLVMQLLSDIILAGSQKYLPVMITLFIFILSSNLLGLIPQSFTLTSHLSVTFFMSFAIFVAMNIIGFQKHGLKLFSLFLPSNTAFLLALLLVPIELISYIAKPISLGVRLFINLMAGHSLLKVIAGFSWNILLVEQIQAIAFIIPILILILLMGLELGVALIQAYVFITLTAIYLNDSEMLH